MNKRMETNKGLDSAWNPTLVEDEPEFDFEAMNKRLDTNKGLDMAWNPTLDEIPEAMEPEILIPAIEAMTAIAPVPEIVTYTPEAAALIATKPVPEIVAPVVEAMEITDVPEIPAPEFEAMNEIAPMPAMAELDAPMVDEAIFPEVTAFDFPQDFNFDFTPTVNASEEAPAVA